MTKNLTSILAASIAVAGLSAGVAFAAPSSFQNSCSNINFIYQGADAALGATCLRANGTPNASVILIGGISNQNGALTQGSGPSSFQQSCGNIQIQVQGEGQVLLTALCRTTGGTSQPSRIELQNISNENGVLKQN